MTVAERFNFLCCFMLEMLFWVRLGIKSVSLHWLPTWQFCSLFNHNDSSCKTSIILVVGPLTFNLIYIEETWRTKRHWSLQQPSQRPYCTVVRWLISAGKWLAPLSWSLFLQPVWSSPVWWSTGHILCSCLCPAPGLRSVWLTPQTSCEDFDKRQIFYSHIISSV